MPKPKLHKKRRNISISNTLDKKVSDIAESKQKTFSEICENALKEYILKNMLDN